MVALSYGAHYLDLMGSCEVMLHVLQPLLPAPTCLPHACRSSELLSQDLLSSQEFDLSQPAITVPACKGFSPTPPPAALEHAYGGSQSASTRVGAPRGQRRSRHAAVEDKAFLIMRVKEKHVHGVAGRAVLLNHAVQMNCGT